jgi:hypothetical protein
MCFLRVWVVVVGVLFVYVFLQARPYLDGVIGGGNKVKLNQRAQRAASNYVYAQELMKAIDSETDPTRRDELIKELNQLKP